MPYADPEKRAQAKRASYERMMNDPVKREEVRIRSKARNRAYYKANKETILARLKTNYETDPKRSETLKARARREGHRLREEMLDAYGRECACCHESEPRFLCLDHIGGGGNKDRSLVGGNNQGVLRRLRVEGWPQDDFRVLCANCNMATMLGRICPHQEET